jgi:hypothetical protein
MIKLKEEVENSLQLKTDRKSKMWSATLIDLVFIIHGIISECTFFSNAFDVFTKLFWVIYSLGSFNTKHLVFSVPWILEKGAEDYHNLLLACIFRLN